MATAGLIGVASPANAAIVPVTAAQAIDVFPMRDFVGIGGYGVGANVDVRVLRDGVQIGDAGPLTLAADAELNGFGEVNHPGGICWNGVTPDLVAGDVVQAVDADGNGHFTVVQNVEVTQPATAVALDGDGIKDDVVARGMASNVEGTGRINQANVEQRVINPDLTGTTVGRRDVRAIFGDGLADGVDTLGQIRWDDPTPGSTDPHWTATYRNVGQHIASLIEAGQSRMLAWERTNTAGDRIGMTLWEYGELGGPGFGGCPALQKFAVGGATPKNINIATSQQANLTLSGTATNVDSVTVAVNDHDPSTPAVTGTATIARPASLDGTVPLPGNTTWNVALPMNLVNALKDDTLVASATFGFVQEPATPGDARTSTPIGGSDLIILKDTVAPVAPTAFPGGGRYTGPQSVTINPGDEVEDVVRYRVGATAATTADPTAASPVVPLPLSVTTTQTVKARSFDQAGNPSPVATNTYTIGAATAPAAPTNVTATPGNSQATVSWTAPGDDGGSPITGAVVETYQGAAFLKSNSFTTTNPSVIVPGLTNGTAYTFRVRAVNAVGQSPLSASSNEIRPAAPVGTDTTPPTLTARAPAINAQSVGLTANTRATFSEAVTGVSGTTVVLRTAAGASVGAAVTYNATTRVATLDPTGSLAADTRYTASLTAGIRDTAGNPLAPVSWSFTTGPAPTVTGRTPAINGTGFSRVGNVTVTFSENVQGVGPTTARLTNSATGAAITSGVTYNATTRVATINPGVTLAANTLYRVRLTTNNSTGIRDLANNPLGAAVVLTWTFRTGA